jgi:hypothetical protein
MEDWKTGILPILHPSNLPNSADIFTCRITSLYSKFVAPPVSFYVQKLGKISQITGDPVSFIPLALISRLKIVVLCNFAILP